MCIGSGGAFGIGHLRGLDVAGQDRPDHCARGEDIVLGDIQFCTDGRRKSLGREDPSSDPYFARSCDAVFSPIPRTPGSPSEGSPRRIA